MTVVNLEEPREDRVVSETSSYVHADLLPGVVATTVGHASTLPEHRLHRGVPAYDASGDQVDHAQLDWPEGGGVLLGSRRDNGIEPGLASIYVVTDHVDEVHDRVKDAAGVTIVRPLEDPGYGGRAFVMTDPEGNFWSFGSYRGEPSAEA